MPEAKPFRDLYSAAAREALATLLRQLQAKWSLRVVDARDWVDDAGFWDTHHLLDVGARTFTDRFGREILRPALLEWPATAYADCMRGLARIRTRESERRSVSPLVSAGPTGFATHFPTTRQIHCVGVIGKTAGPRRNP